MDAKITQAAMAYGQAIGRAGQAPLFTDDDGVVVGPGGGAAGTASFSDLLRDTLAQAVDSTRAAETATARASMQEGELVDVITAVTNAEITLQTVVAVRDQLIQSYQEIMRMPI